MAWFPPDAAPGLLPPRCDCEHCPSLLAELDAGPNEAEQLVIIGELTAVHSDWRNHPPTAYYVGHLRYWEHNSHCQGCGPDTPAVRVGEGAYVCSNEACGEHRLCACEDCVRFVLEFPACPNILPAASVRTTHARAQACEEREEAVFAAGLE